MKRGKLLLGGLLGLGVVAMAAWGALTLWFTLPIADGPRGALALGFVTFGVGGLLVAGLRRRIVAPLLAPGGAYAGKVKVILRLHPQPWHAVSTLVHEAALAVRTHLITFAADPR